MTNLSGEFDANAEREENEKPANEHDENNLPDEVPQVPKPEVFAIPHHVAETNEYIMWNFITNKTES